DPPRSPPDFVCIARADDVPWPPLLLPLAPTVEKQFDFVRADGPPMSCELRFHGEPYGWEAQFLERGELICSRGGFVLRELAAQWARLERDATMNSQK
ncbi:MAG: hypothetical protein DMG00_29270, partial [Acidobacteria bacterium]